MAIIFFSEYPVIASALTSGTINGTFVSYLYRELLSITIHLLAAALGANVFVASGKADLYQENDIFLWDVAAGAVLVKEAGGKISISEPTKEFRVNAIFSNGLIW